MRLIVFDVDGTLVDSQHLIVEAMTRAFRANGLTPPERSRALSIVGLSLPEAMTQLIGADGPVMALAEAYKTSFQDIRREAVLTEPLFPGARETVESLAGLDDVILGIATGKSRRGVEIVLRHHGLGTQFFTIQTADDHPSKPHPAMLEAAMAETGVDPGQTVFVGDTSFDMEMARASGATGIGVAWGYHAVEALHDSGARQVVDSYAELHTVLGLTDPALAAAL